VFAAALLSVSTARGQVAHPQRGQSSPKQLSAPFKLCAGGDVTLGTNLDLKWARPAADTLWREFGLRPDPDSLINTLRPFFSGADVILVNVEGAIGESPVESKCGPRSKNCFAFRQPPAAAAALRRLGDTSVAVVGNIANNHSLDAGEDGRDTTIAYLTTAGVRVTGHDSLATPVPLASGDTIGVLGFYTDDTTPDARDLRAVQRYVSRAVAQYGTVIVTMHLGAEGTTAQRTRNAIERFLNIDRGNPVGFANAAFAGGATVVIGHGPHVLRAAEWRGDRLVLYSLGNLLTYGPFKMHEPTNRGAVACATVDGPGRVSRAELRPTMQRWPGVLQPDSSRRAFTLVDSLSRLDFPKSGAKVDGAGQVGRRGKP
jgi:poly-gamma-glutamate capsule biosynthesis protein CapA/YwtB (metallophosphatase superfamily)